MKERFEAWLAEKERAFSRAITQEALNQEFITEGQVVECKLISPKKNSMMKEYIYWTKLGKEDIKKLSSVKWSLLHKKVIDALLEENPRREDRRSEGQSWWWSQNYQGAINAIFRRYDLPWRVVSTGKWDNRLVYLGTIVDNDEEPIARLKFNSQGGK